MHPIIPLQFTTPTGESEVRRLCDKYGFSYQAMEAELNGICRFVPVGSVPDAQRRPARQVGESPRELHPDDAVEMPTYESDNFIFSTILAKGYAKTARTTDTAGRKRAIGDFLDEIFVDLK